MKETKASPPSSAAVSRCRRWRRRRRRRRPRRWGGGADGAPPGAAVVAGGTATGGDGGAAGRGGRDGVGGQEAAVSVERRGEHSAVCRWSVAAFPRVKARALWSRYFEVGGYDCRLLVYPRGDSQALPGYLSVYLQIVDPAAARARLLPLGGTASPVIALSIPQSCRRVKSIHRDSWHRFSSKKKSHGWCDFTPAAAVLDPRAGFLSGPGESLVVTADILVLDESVSFSRDIVPHSDHHHHTRLSRRRLWRGLGAPVLGDTLNGKQDAEKSLLPSDRSCWCLFRMSVLNQRQSSGASSVVTMSIRTPMEGLQQTARVGIIPALVGGREWGGARKSDGHFGKFTWRIENFTRLKDLLKKRKITGLCVKSRRFQIGNRDCRLIVYPRGQSQPPCHLSVFLEVTDSKNTSSDWSCFVSHRLSVVNQKLEEKSITKESQIVTQRLLRLGLERVCNFKQVSLTRILDSLYRTLSYFLPRILHLEGENFSSFKEIMETRKIFSKFFQAGGCELRIGVYESFDTICIYLESDQSAGSDPDKNFWVQYRMAVVNQKNPAKTVWKESSICTKTWNNSVLQFMKVSDMQEADAGFLVGDTVVFVCEILDCCPWFEFSDLDALASEDDQDALSTDPDELIDSEDSECVSGDEEDMFRNLLSRAGFHLTYGDNSSQPQPDEFTDGVKVLQQAIIDLLLDIMVECCQHQKKGEPRFTRCSLEGRQFHYRCAAVQSSVYQRLDHGSEDNNSGYAVQSSDLTANETDEKIDPVRPCFPSVTSAEDLSVDDGFIRSKTKWPEQSEELLGLIVNSLSALDSAVPQGCPEPRRRPQSNIPLLLVFLIDCLQKPDKETELWMPVFGALNQLEFSPEVWQRALFQAFNLLADSNDELLVAAISFVFKAASQCQLLLTRLGEQARAVRSRLKSLGPGVPQCVLGYIEPDGDSSLTTRTVFPDSVNALSMGLLSTSEEQAVYGSQHIADIYVLIEMLSIPAIFVDVSQVFVRAISRGAITLQSVAMVLERRHSQMFAMKSSAAADDEALPVQNDDYTSLLNLGQVLSLSKDSRVQDFVCELAHVDRATLWHQLCAMENENLRAQEDRQTELANFFSNKAVLAQRLSESEATVNRLKAETERFVRERKELSEQIAEEGPSGSSYDAEVQLSQLKSRKRAELKSTSPSVCPFGFPMVAFCE
ncbi:unnamed protein product [Spirodela intermedia]|uniref:MATH domain-containing protein n=1 Tax=Spirodela intermedia TaxID=51605 RepID=A0ABN7EAU8_SPIIN|nr:unnamed protein product [Spirodela intermedia]